MGLPTIPVYPLPIPEEVPKARGPWQAAPSRSALLVHDMQRYFLRPFPENASPITPVIENIARLITHARRLGIPVFYTAQKGNQERISRGLQGDLWGPGMQAIEEHEQIVAPLQPHPQDKVLLKHRYSAFQRSNLEELLREANRNQLMITGVYAHIGCQATAVEAFQRDIEAFIVSDGVADFSREHHDRALHWIADCCGVPIFTDELIEKWS